MPEPAPSSKRQTRLAALALVGMALGWGYNWVVMKQALQYVGPFAFSALRTLLGAFALLLVLAAMRGPLRVRAWRRMILFGVLQTGVFNALIQIALLDGAAGKTSILVYTMPFWVIPMAWLVFGERIRGWHWPALGLALIGLLLLVEPWQAHASLTSELLAVAAGLCWALATLVAKWIQRDEPMDALSLTSWQMLFGALALCVAAWLIPERPIDPAPYFVGALLYNAVIASALAWFFWVYALQHLPTGVAGLSSLGVPVVGVMAGWLELGERPTPLDAIGMVLLVLALFGVALEALRKER